MADCSGTSADASTDGQKETSIKDFTEDVMLIIISKLSLRDAVILSSVCKQWSYLPSSLYRIKLDTSIVKGECPGNKDSFNKAVNQFLLHYFKVPSKSVSLRGFEIFFCFNRHSSKDVDSWISMAFLNGIRWLLVDPNCVLHYSTIAKDDDKYVFPWQKLHNLPIALENLSLRSCIFNCCITSKWMSLQLIELIDSNITAYDMDRISFCFPNLRKLILLYCKVPDNFILGSASLITLWMWLSRDLKKIDLLNAKALTEFSYQGRYIDLDRINSPKLTNLRLGFQDVNGDDYVFQNLRGVTVTSLSIYRDRERLQLHSPAYGPMSSFYWLKELKLYNHPSKSVSRQTMTKILKACPNLTRLEMVPPCSLDDSDIESDTYQYIHKSLCFIKISGFCGSKANVDMAKFLVQVPEELHHVVVESEVNNYEYNYVKHSADWHGEEEPQVVRGILLRLIKREQLTFLCTQNTVHAGMVNKYKKLLKTFCLWC